MVQVRVQVRVEVRVRVKVMVRDKVAVSKQQPRANRTRVQLHSEPRAQNRCSSIPLSGLTLLSHA